jgi:predicted Holliday junction resolvase-like endonuclease
MLIGIYVKTFNFLNIGKLASNKNLIYGLLIFVFLLIMLTESVNIYLVKNKKKIKENSSEKLSNEELKQKLLDEMRQELLKEIEEENKANEEDGE